MNSISLHLIGAGPRQSAANSVWSPAFCRKPLLFLFGSLVALIGISGSAADLKTNTESRLVIVKAIYGDPNDASATIDVTKQVAAQVKDNAVELRAGNDTFDDPASGANKALKVDYTIDGVPGKKIVYENGLLRLSLKDKPDPDRKPSTKLVIRKAMFGDLPDGNANDVTADIRDRVKDDSLTVNVNIDDFGDPAGGRPKRLQVDYTFDGKERSKSAGNGETLTISADGN